MLNTPYISFILIIINIAFSYKGFTNTAFFDGYKIEVDKILKNKDYKRIITSGFLHVGWMHLIFNILSLYAFGDLLERSQGSIQFLIIYFAGLIGGNLLSLFIHKNHGDYNAVGASGAVCGIIFASIVLYPNLGISFFGMPFHIPSWLYGILYVLYSIYGIKSQKDNIGHEAHLGGALIGMLVALMFVPFAFLENFVTILLILIPTVAFIYFIIKKPQILLIDNLHFKTLNYNYTIDDRYREERNNNQKELDKILDKISNKGMDSLSKKEREMLNEFSKK